MLFVLSGCMLRHWAAGSHFITKVEVKHLRLANAVIEKVKVGQIRWSAESFDCTGKELPEELVERVDVCILVLY